MASGVGCVGLSCLLGSWRIGIIARTGKKATVLRGFGDGVVNGFVGGRVSRV